MNQPVHRPAGSTRRLYPLTPAAVTLADGFWAPRLDTLRTVTIHDVFDKFERDGAFENFDRAARGLAGGHRGMPWFDGLVFETMRAAADFLAAGYDARLDARLDGYIARISAAQAPDGYLNTFVMLTRPAQRWGAGGSDQLWTHEEYDAGCLIEAGVHHFQATGKTALLAPAVRFADHLCAYIGPAPRHNVVPSHSLPEEALIKLYRLLRAHPDLAARLSPAGDPGRYLELVRFWMDNRGNHAGRVSFSEYAQDHCCLADQPEAVGHSVRGTLLYAGLAVLAAETGESQYAETALRLWRDVADRKMFITGGVGPIKEYEGFGYGYYLPNSGYIETCAGAGLAFWAGQMSQAFGAGEYMDVYERVLYNNVLAGVSLDGTKYSYENPLSNHGSMHRWDWHSCPCCPPMLLKLFSEMPGLVFARDEKDLFVNLYAASRARVDLPGGAVELEFETGYPWDGAARLTLRQVGSGDFDLRLRVPGWCRGWRVRVNGAERADAALEDGYAALNGPWRAGDVVELDLEMPVERVVCHPYSLATRERVAIQRGPLVYCLEGVDNPGPSDPALPARVHFQTEYRPDLLGGVTVVRVQAAGGETLTAVPYYAWDNRPAPSAERDWLAVWLRQEDWFALRQPLDAHDRRDWTRTLYRAL